MKRSIHALIFLALCCAVVSPVSASAATADDTYEADVLTHTNTERTTRNLKAVAASIVSTSTPKRRRAR